MTSLAQLVSDETILLDVQADDSEELIRAMAGALAEAGLVDPDYAERCIERERSNPTGLETVAGSIALPHADPRAGEQAGIAFARPAAPVEFGAMADDGTVDAKVVFLLAVAGGEAHLDALAEVVDVVQDAESMAALLTARAPRDVKQALMRRTE